MCFTLRFGSGNDEEAISGHFDVKSLIGEYEQGNRNLLEILEGAIHRRVNQHDWYATSPGEGEGL